GGEGWSGLTRIRLAPIALALLVPLLLLGVAGRAGHRWMLAHHIERMESGDFGRPVRIVQPNLPIRKEWDPAEAYRDYKKAIDLAAESCEPGALVILPESALWPFSYDHDPVVKSDLDSLIARGCSIVFNGQAEAAGTAVFNSAYLLAPAPRQAPGAPTLSRYDKRHLVPFGEYIPFSAVLGWVGRMARGIGEYTPGTAPTLLPWNGSFEGQESAASRLVPPAHDRIGMAICYEVVYPEEVAELSQAGATLLATITNDAWYGDTAAPHQHLRAARFRAAENRKTLLRAALTGISALVAPDGSERQRIALGTTGVIRARVWGESEITPYARAPWLPPLLCSVGALFAIIFCRFRR
ncbi:MAG TPA: apolipoprotein N-acyltransferase, partial [Thermoanaerobaculia bacterium]|nr:apolipoprotein N-acyltransferase [Thermoanaerobaculia bacterium]